MANRIYPRVVPNPSAALGYDGTDFRVLLVDTSGRPLISGQFVGSENEPLLQDVTGSLLANVGHDGTNWRNLKVDADRHVQSDILSSALPTGAATAAKQDTEITALQLIDDLRNVLESVGADQLRVRAGYDGSGYRVLLTDSDGHLIVTPRPFKTYTKVVVATNIDAGSSRTDVDLDGAGFFLYAAYYVDGAAVEAGNSYFTVTIDGEDEPSIHLRCSSIQHDIISYGGVATSSWLDFQSCPYGWGGILDGTNFRYSGGFALTSHFASHLKVIVYNGDPHNATLCGTKIGYALWT